MLQQNFSWQVYFVVTFIGGDNRKKNYWQTFKVTTGKKRGECQTGKKLGKYWWCK